jgi:hypothetical protein
MIEDQYSAGYNWGRCVEMRFSRQIGSSVTPAFSLAISISCRQRSY